MEALTELVKDRKYLAGIFLVHAMFWVVLSQLDFFCDTCDRSYSFSALFSDFQYTIPAMAIVCLPSTVFSFFVYKFFSRNSFYKSFYITSFVLALTIIYIIF